MPDPRTIAFYDDAAGRFANLMDAGSPQPQLLAFMALLPKAGQVLDLGCGAAQASVHLRAAGFRPDPVDASLGMVELANATHDIGARQLTFDQIDMVAAYDGVWANYALLHAPGDDLPDILSAIALALRPGGILHVSMLVGEGEERDTIDRLYTYVTVSGLHDLMTDAGFDVIAVEEGHKAGCGGTSGPVVTMRARKRA